MDPAGGEARVMAARPILFSAPMVRALLAGSKSQTRRVINPQPPSDFVSATFDATQMTVCPAMLFGSPFHKQLRRLYRPGDRLYVREAWRAQEEFDDISPAEIGKQFEEETGTAWCPVFYEADQRCDGSSVDIWQQSPPGRLHQGMHMPRWASRLTLIVTDVHVQRLQEISEADAMAEGIKSDTVGVVRGHFVDQEATAAWPDDMPLFWAPDDDSDECLCRSAVDAYHRLWDELNEERGFGWDTNPWVVAVSFRVVNANIDSLGEVK